MDPLLSATPDPRWGVPILTYHSLDESGSVISIAPAVFRLQMQHLRDRGFEGLSLGDLFDAWDDRATLPERPVVLTFDDGFRNVKEHAAPLLEKMGFHATIFVVPGYCGGTNDWPDQSPAAPRLPLCSWSELREMSSRSFEVGAHGMTHAPIAGLAVDEEHREVVESKQVIEDYLGQPVSAFAYPYGIATPSARELARTHYRGACSVEMTTARVGDDRYWLGRIDMYYLRNPRVFRLLGTSMGQGYLALRALGRMCRSALFPARPGASLG